MVTMNAIRGNARLFLLNIGNFLNSTYMITEYNEYNSNVNIDCLSKLLKECKYSIYLPPPQHTHTHMYPHTHTHARKQANTQTKKTAPRSLCNASSLARTSSRRWSTTQSRLISLWLCTLTTTSAWASSNRCHVYCLNHWSMMTDFDKYCMLPAFNKICTCCLMVRPRNAGTWWYKQLVLAFTRICGTSAVKFQKFRSVMNGAWIS